IRKLVEKELQNEKVDRVEWVSLYAKPDFEICLKVVLAPLTSQVRMEFFNKHERKRSLLKSHIERHSQGKFLLKGNLLIKLGVSKFKIGKLIEEGERLAIKQNLSDPEAVIEHLKKTDLWKQN